MGQGYLGDLGVRIALVTRRLEQIHIQLPIIARESTDVGITQSSTTWFEIEKRYCHLVMELGRQI